MKTWQACLFVFAIVLSSTELGYATEYKPVWNALCGAGKELQTGCDAIRARKIADASQQPLSAIGRINFADYRNRQHCTGVLIAERIVLTAAHCLYSDKKKQWLVAGNIHFVAGYQRSEYVASSRVESYVVAQLPTSGKPAYKNNPARDWAIVILEKPIGQVAGYLEWDTIDITELEALKRAGGKLLLAGYPAIRPHVLSLDINCKQENFQLVDDFLLHRCATMQGDSGGPIILKQNGIYTVLGINSGATQHNGKINPFAVPINNFSEQLKDTLERLK